MKKLIIVLLLFQSYYLCSAADLDKLNNLFESANKLYNDGKYLEANYLYKDIAASNFVSKDLYYKVRELIQSKNRDEIFEFPLVYGQTIHYVPNDNYTKDTILKIIIHMIFLHMMKGGMRLLFCCKFATGTYLSGKK